MVAEGDGISTRARDATPETRARVLEIIERVGEKWTLMVLNILDRDGETRYSRLRDQIDGISQRMLTKTLRGLERDGLVARRIHASVPPRVDYRLTPLGAELGEAVCRLWIWVDAHTGAIENARVAFDARNSVGGSRKIRIRRS